ncbi:MAG: ScpA family protein [Candidatus Aenigmatarchaeota archaeon]|nr:segregation/condensation protein A [Candidatus Aenigmarchaeota archaeon]
MQENKKLSDQDIINITINEPSWEDVIVKIVIEENIDPWNLDLVKLCDAFIEYLKKLEKYDLRIPARFILISAILLRMKSDILSNKKERILIPEGPENERDSELLRILASIPPLQPPLKRVTFANVTLSELITALKKAFEVEKRRVMKKEKIRAKINEILPKDEEDINDRIAKLLENIMETIEHVEKITTFKKIVKKWERKEIVKTFLPMLYLDQEGKIECEQPILFEDIFIKLKSEETKNPENKSNHNTK